jgi:hypothetical protein
MLFVKSAPTTSHPTVFFSQNKSASIISKPNILNMYCSNMGEILIYCTVTIGKRVEKSVILPPSPINYGWEDSW